MSDKRINQPRRSPMGGGPMGSMAGIEKAKNFRGTMKKLGEYLKPYLISIITVIIFAVGSASFSIAGPKILGRATTKIFEGLVSKVSGAAGAGIDFEYISSIILLLAALYVISSFFSFVQGFIITGVAQKVSYNMRRDISQKINRMPLKYFDTKTHGEVLSRVTNDVDTVSQSLNQSLSQIITSGVTLIGVLAMMLSISWMMTLASILILPLSILLISLIIKRSQVFFRKQQEYLGRVNSHVEEMYGGHVIMKAFNGEEKALLEFSRQNELLYASAWKSQFLSGMMMPIMTFVGNLGYVMVSILGGWLAIKKAIEVGDILSFIQYVSQFTQPISQIAQISNVLQSTAAAAERVFEFLEEEEEFPETEQPISADNVAGEVSFRNVRFGYNPDSTIIKGFSAIVSPGQRVAIVGPTGAGKTTIVKLLMRFYDVNSGEILIDGN
ncbi:MAG TPA: ABC transporter ATP-binding protein, partial [Negativicutes bacterium]|nr:ABC transporter ATP-binding protein [Negativicutes bacterium]